MLTWRIWGDIPTPFLTSLDNFIEKSDKNNEILLVCPEEFEIDSNYDFSKLLEFKKVKIIYGTYDKSIYNYLPKEFEIELWPNFFLYHSASSSVRTSTSLKISKLFTCMNAKPHWHRGLLIDLLAKHNLLSSNFYSWHNFYCQSDYKFQYWKPRKVVLDGKFTGQQNCFPTQMYQSVFDLVSETSTDIPFITEKTYNAIVLKKPFLIYGVKGIHRYLESTGYKLNHDVVDYSFDDEIDNHRRAEKLVEELVRLSKLDLRKLHKHMKKTTDYNFEHAKNQINSHYGVPKDIFQFDHYTSIINYAIERMDSIY